MSEEYYRTWEPLFGVHDVAKGTLVVLTPHPDDEVLGAGGLILGHRDHGQDVHVVMMTDGALGDFGKGDDPTYVARRREEAAAAAEALAGAHLHFLDFPDGSLRPLMSAADQEPVRRVRALLNELAPATVAFPSPYELHPDHRATGLAAIAAVTDLSAPPKLLAYEVGSFMPGNMLLDISHLFERKVAALRCHTSQLEHHDLVSKMTGLDVARTANVDVPGITHCEAYLRVDPARASEFLAASENLLRLTDSMTPPVPYE